MPTLFRFRRIEARGFQPDAETIGEAVRAQTAVLLDLSRAGAESKRRLIDFASGACFSRRWAMTRLGADGFLLTPPTEPQPPRSYVSASP